MDIGQYDTDMYIMRMERRIQKIYAQAVDEMTKKLDDYLRKYKVKDKIKREQLRKGEITRAEYNYWKTGQIAIGQRWEEMKDTLAKDLHNANLIARSYVQGQMPGVYALNHNYATFQVEKASLVDTSYTLYDRDTVQGLIKDGRQVLPYPGKKMQKKLANNPDIKWQYGQIQSVMTQSILQGESIPNMAKRICNTLGESNRKASVRYARTASTAAQNAGRVDAYKRAEDMGIELEQEWLAVMDGRTRHEHRQLDGQHVKVGEPFRVDGEEIKFPGDPSAPGYLIWNCRCTLIPRIEGIDNTSAHINSKLGDMSYEEWKNEHQKFEMSISEQQTTIGQAKTVKDINKFMNSQNWFSKNSKVDLTGCDVESAKSIASSYSRMFDRFPQLKGQFDAPDAHPRNMGNNTYAWCYIKNGGKVQVNPIEKFYGKWSNVVKSYEADVLSRWHPQGTTAESIVIHELGHAVDGLLARKGILGGYTSSGEYRYASSSLKGTIMRRCAKQDPDLDNLMQLDRWLKDNSATENYVSRYAAKNPQEWFAECFAEYLTSADPRLVAREFGKELEKLLEKLT